MMVERALATKLVLRALGQSEQIVSLDDRKRLQKVVYLAQAAGVNLGYGFSWYLMGPYSSSLAKDYYNMPSADLSAPGSPALKAEVMPLLATVKAIVEDHRRPAELSTADWLEIVSSVHYLDKISRLDTAAADDKLRREKPNLAPYAGIARNLIQEYFSPAQAN